jgi:hypothetical protein
MQLLTDNSFFLSGTCTCGGTLQEKYRSNEHLGIEVKIFPKKSKFRIKNNGSLVEEGPLIDLEEKLNKYINKSDEGF